MSDAPTTVGFDLPDTGQADSGQADPEERGSTTVSPAVVQRIAEVEVCRVPGVVATGSGLEKVVGRQYPKVNANVAGARARLSMEIAVAWPLPLADTCARARDTLISRLEELTGLSIDAVDITAAKVVQPEPPTTRRVQ